ncbi:MULTISPECIES: ABC transporter substrate-binding protein [unclassified Rhizobacter]|uniref:ABC transporter substrate-binding protein n=1 Tax=unclassified Rhizobacter TaxID=2640088 RepID=UPI00138EE46B|nr:MULTISPECIES: ABC transporter substrate-binding protein [unclassified Rhizobacter]
MLLGCTALGAQAQTLDVLHWWTSAGERRAVDQLVLQLDRRGIAWRDAAIPGGGGGGAMKVLNSRVLARDPPDAAQVIGRTLADWSDLGLVLPLDEVAQRNRWSQSLFPLVQRVITHRGRIVAAPLGVHRINTLFFNQRVWAQLKLGAPKTWGDVEQAAAALRRAGIAPFAWSDEPWQIATVFETLLLSEGGPVLYAELAATQRWQAWQDPRVAKALERLRWLRRLNGETVIEQRWTASARQLFTGDAGMLIMGDWTGGELTAWGAQPGRDYGCAPVPGTAGMHLYSIDTLAMLVGTKKREAEQERMAEVVVSPAAQLAYNQAKGSVPVRDDIDPTQLDECARDSWQTLKRADSPLLPSIAHRMAADEATKDALADALHRFVKDPAVTPARAQERLAALIRSAARATPSQ